MTRIVDDKLDRVVRDPLKCFTGGFKHKPYAAAKELIQFRR